MRSISRAAIVAAWFLFAMWSVFLLSLILPIDLQSLGIRPRNVHGLIGIPLAPFLHENFRHISANSTAIFMLLVIAFILEYSSAIRAIVMITLIGGFGTWLFGSPNSVHIGASGLIFGLIGYLLFRGWHERNVKTVAVSLLVLVLYGGSLYALLMIVPGISWSGHLFGFVGGIIAAQTKKR